jgi:hypothetical protein
MVLKVEEQFNMGQSDNEQMRFTCQQIFLQNISPKIDAVQ